MKRLNLSANNDIGPKHFTGSSFKSTQFYKVKLKHTIQSAKCRYITLPGGGVFPEKLGGGVRPTSQNPIYDQNLPFSLPYL